MSKHSNEFSKQAEEILKYEKYREEFQKSINAHFEKIIEKRNNLKVNTVFGPGTYFIGDPCYAMEDLPDDGHTENYAIYPTTIGDWTATGSDGKEYGVDAGIFGTVRLTPNRITKEDMDTLHRLGSVVEVKNQMEFHYDGGRFHYMIDGKDLIVDFKAERENNNGN